LVLAERGEMLAEQIASAVEAGVEATRFHLEELVKQDMVHDYLSTLEPTTYEIDHEGRRYLIGKGLIR
jgi:predicted ArsR family transcriptional regulator